MRIKTPKVLVTFETTSDALGMESAARTHDIPGRIVPVPTEISAGCGYAWYADAADRPALQQALAQHALPHQAIHELLMY